ncbi:MAG: nitrogen regulation protein NR(II) [Terriglobia bacterium]
MDLYLADALTTFLAIILVTVVFLVFSRRELVEPFFKLWAIGWIVMTLQYLSQVGVMINPARSHTVMFLDRTLLASAGIIFFLSARSFSGLRTPRVLVAALGVLFTVTSYFQIYHAATPLPIFVGSDIAPKVGAILASYHFSEFGLLLGILVLVTGMQFLQAGRKAHSIGIQILACGFLTMGLGLVSFIFILKWRFILPFAVQFLDFARLAVAVGMLIHLFEREKIAVQRHRDDAVNQREFIQSLVDNANDSIFVTDHEGKFQWANKKCEKGLGLTSEELKGRSYREFLRGKDRVHVEQAAAAVFQGKPQSLEIQIEAPQENYRFLQISMSPVHDAENRVSGVLTVGRDVTEMKTMERQIQHADKLMALGQMISGAAHELNNPLTTVMGFSELSLQDKALDPKLRQRFDRILQAAARSKKIVESLQSFVRVPEHSVEPIEVNDLVVESLSLFEKDFEASQIHTKLRFGHDPMWVNVNRDRLVQVIQSVLKNSMEAIGEVKDGGTISITTGMEGDNSVVSISDDGPGIKDPNRLFEPFYTTKEVGKGTGMALSVGHSILKHYGGKISAENNIKGGATFRIILPIVPVDLTPQSQLTLNAH